MQRPPDYTYGGLRMIFRLKVVGGERGMGVMDGWREGGMEGGMCFMRMRRSCMYLTQRADTTNLSIQMSPYRVKENTISINRETALPTCGVPWWLVAVICHVIPVPEQEHIHIMSQ